MCFSAQASFIAGTGLTVFGIYLLKSVRQQKEKYLKAIPLMFGIQQLCEGVVWITQTNPDFTLYNTIARYSFLFFAFVMWPSWIPFSMLRLESSSKRKRCLSSLLGAGAVISTSLGWVALNLGVTSIISCNHIEYVLDLPKALVFPGVIWYCVATIAPFFIVKQKYMKEFGIALFASVLISAYFYATWFTSVWCFFAALLSVMVYKIKIK